MLLGPGYKRISVPIFVNKTLEPDVEVVISQALASEFIMEPRLKLVYSGDADCVVRGMVTSYQTDQAISFDSLNRIAEYRLTLTVEVKVEDAKSNEVLWETKGLTVTADYPVPQQLTEIKNAEERALRVAAGKIGRSIIRIMENF